MHRVDRFDSEGWFSSDQMIFLTVLRVFLLKKHAPFKWKDAISGLPVSPGSAEAQVIWGGIIKRILIAYFISNISTKKISKSIHVRQSYSKPKAENEDVSLFYVQEHVALRRRAAGSDRFVPVSYTHLTLPTIYSV